MHKAFRFESSLIFVKQDVFESLDSSTVTKVEISNTERCKFLHVKKPLTLSHSQLPVRPFLNYIYSNNLVFWCMFANNIK